MRLLIVYLFIASTFISCTSATKSPGLSAVLAVYGGRAAESTGFIASINSGGMSGRFFEIKLARGVELLRPEFSDFSEPALNAAYLFYHNLTTDQRKDFDFGRIVLEDEQRSLT